MEYKKIYSRFLSRIKDKNLLKLSSDDFYDLMSDYLHNSVSNPMVRKLFTTLLLNDEVQELEYELINSIDEKSDYEFVIEIISQSLVIQWMTHNLDTDLSLALTIGGKEEKVLKNNLKDNYARLDALDKQLQRTIRNHGYYNGTYSKGE